MWISVAVGLYYWFNAFTPILAWYGWRKYAILDESTNPMYTAAWYTLYSLHWLVFTPMALLWPATYLGEGLVVDFYDIANFWLGSVVAAGIYASVVFLWLLAILLYEESPAITRSRMVQELIAYLLLEGFTWYTSVFEYPKAHNNFYYANRSQYHEAELARPGKGPDVEPLSPSLKSPNTVTEGIMKLIEI